jgi:hypothetical protein
MMPRILLTVFLIMTCFLLFANSSHYEEQGGYHPEEDEHRPQEDMHRHYGEDPSENPNDMFDEEEWRRFRDDYDDDMEDDFDWDDEWSDEHDDL